MSDMTEDLLLLARLDNKITPEYKNIDISILIKNIVERMKPLVASKNIKLAYENSDSFIIKGVSEQLERVILNILQNSIDHTPVGGSIELKLEKDGPKVVIHITDTGSGIAKKDLPHIFTRFYKGNSGAGTGLGLSIVKEIVEKHQGNITIESELGKGTKVKIDFPIS